MPSRMFVVSAIGVAAIACGGARRGPAATASSSELLPFEEQSLATAVAKKRAGDPVGAWRLVEHLPASSPARFDPRYTEVMSAWADARTRELGTEISGSRGGGPPVGTVESDQPRHTLTADKIEDLVAAKRGKLRAACFGEVEKRTSFTLKLRIDAEGRVLEAAISDVKGDAAVADCVRSHAAAWSFPRNFDGAEHRTKFIFAR